MAFATVLAMPMLVAGGQNLAGRSPRREAWRWKLFQLSKDSPEFQFAKPSEKFSSSGSGKASHLDELPLWWKQRDKLFEEEGLFCNIRWLGVQVLQSPEDLFHLQKLISRLRPQVVLETGTYRGGLAFYAASILSQLNLERARVITLDVFDMDSNFDNFDNHPLCPVCADCSRAHQTELWRKHVVFFQGNSIRMSEEVHHFIKELHAKDGHWGPTLVSLDAQHSYDGTLTELHLYAGLVEPGSYIILQDARLDDTYGRAGPLTAGARMAEDRKQWLVDDEISGAEYTQHLWLRRLANGPPVSLLFEVYSKDIVEFSPFTLLAEDARCANINENLQHFAWADSHLVCQALCYRESQQRCRFLSFSPQLGCTLRQDCVQMEPEAGAVVYEQQFRDHVLQ